MQIIEAQLAFERAVIHMIDVPRAQAQTGEQVGIGGDHVLPDREGGGESGDLDEVAEDLVEFDAEVLDSGLLALFFFDRRKPLFSFKGSFPQPVNFLMIAGFDDDDTLIMGLESRTSSPVRINRDDSLQSLSMRGLYPCGEGAGYAGGIMSAAMDGLRVAEKIVHS